MKLIIAGSRGLSINVLDIDHVVDFRCLPASEVVCGLAKGPDSVGKEWAELVKIPVTLFPADWNQFGKKAGILRNCQMGDYADELLAFWDGKSRGTAHMIDYMKQLGKPTHVELRRSI